MENLLKDFGTLSYGEVIGLAFFTAALSGFIFAIFLYIFRLVSPYVSPGVLKAKKAILIALALIFPKKPISSPPTLENKFRHDLKEEEFRAWVSEFKKDGLISLVFFATCGAAYLFGPSVLRLFM